MSIPSGEGGYRRCREKRRRKLQGHFWRRNSLLLDQRRNERAAHEAGKEQGKNSRTAANERGDRGDWGCLWGGCCVLGGVLVGRRIWKVGNRRKAAG